MDPERERRRMLALLPAVADAIRCESDKISRANFSECNVGDVYMVATIHWDHGGSTRPSDLVGVIHSTSAGVTGSLKRLEAAGYIERRNAPEDGRVFLAVVTDTGHDAVLRAVPAFNELAAKVTDGLDDAEIKRMNLLAEGYLESTRKE